MASNSVVNFNIRTVTQDGIVRCNHDVPAARRTATTPQNFGRVFWCCMRHSDDEDQCRFFRWDEDLPPHQNGAGSSMNDPGLALHLSQQTKNSTTQAAPPVFPQVATPQQSPRSSTKLQNPRSPTRSPSHFTHQAPSSPMPPPSPQKTPRRRTTGSQSLTPTQRETVLAAIYAARTTPGYHHDVEMEVDTRMEIDEDEDQKPIMGMDVNMCHGKSKASENMVFEASSFSVDSDHPQTPPGASSASAPPFPSQQSQPFPSQQSHHSQFSQQSSSRHTSCNTPTNPNSIEAKKMIDTLQEISQAMQSLERQKAELERTREVQQRRIDYLEAEVDSLKQEREDLEDSFSEYVLLHG